MAVEAKVGGDGSPDEEGAEGGDHGEGGEGGGPEENAGDAEYPEGETGENSLYESDGEAAEEGGVDRVVNAIEEFRGLVFAEGDEGAEANEGDLAVAKEEEEKEEHDDKFGDEVD